MQGKNYYVPGHTLTSCPGANNALQRTWKIKEKETLHRDLISHNVRSLFFAKISCSRKDSLHKHPKKQDPPRHKPAWQADLRANRNEMEKEIKGKSKEERERKGRKNKRTKREKHAQIVENDWHILKHWTMCVLPSKRIEGVAPGQQMSQGTPSHPLSGQNSHRLNHRKNTK